MIDLTRFRRAAALAILLGLAPAFAQASDGAKAPENTPAANTFEETRADCHQRCKNDFDRCIAAGYEKWICDDQVYNCVHGQCARLTAEPAPTPALTPKP